MSNRGRRHRMGTVNRARELHAAGWTVHAITRLLGKEGTQVTYNTVKAWTDPEYREQLRERSRLANRRRSARLATSRLGRPQHSAIYRDRRARELYALGLSACDVARVMGFDYQGDLWSHQRVLRLLGDGARRADATRRDVVAALGGGALTVQELADRLEWPFTRVRLAVEQSPSAIERLPGKPARYRLREDAGQVAA